MHSRLVENKNAHPRGMLQFFPVNVYYLLEPSVTLYFVTSLVAMNFDKLPNVLIEPFYVCTQMGESVIEKRVYRKCL